MLVLCTLAREPLHGYAINTAIQELSGERLGRGSLSSALARLESKNLIEALDEPGRQRPLRLTAAGREVLERELQSTAQITQRMFEAAVPDRIGYQERLATMDLTRSHKRIMLDALALGPGHCAIDLGCGPGTDLAALAAAVTPAGSVLGVDSDPTMVERAHARSADLASVEVRQADVHDLPVADASLDRAWTDRVLQHVQNPERVLAEARRVLRPRGKAHGRGAGLRVFGLRPSERRDLTRLHPPPRRSGRSQRPDRAAVGPTGDAGGNRGQRGRADHPRPAASTGSRPDPRPATQRAAGHRGRLLQRASGSVVAGQAHTGTLLRRHDLLRRGRGAAAIALTRFHTQETPTRATAVHVPIRVRQCVRTCAHWPVSTRCDQRRHRVVRLELPGGGEFIGQVSEECFCRRFHSP